MTSGIAGPEAALATVVDGPIAVEQDRRANGLDGQDTQIIGAIQATWAATTGTLDIQGTCALDAKTTAAVVAVWYFEGAGGTVELLAIATENVGSTRSFPGGYHLGLLPLP